MTRCLKSYYEYICRLKSMEWICSLDFMYLDVELALSYHKSHRLILINI